MRLEKKISIAILLLTPIYVLGIGIALIAGGIAGDSPSETDAVRLIMGVAGIVLIVLAAAAEIVFFRRFSGRRW